MARRAEVPTPSAITRVLKAVLAAGIPVERFTAVRMSSGGCELRFGDPPPESAANDDDNEWARALNE